MGLMIFSDYMLIAYSPFVCAANLRLRRIAGHAEDLVCSDC